MIKNQTVQKWNEKMNLADKIDEEFPEFNDIRICYGEKESIRIPYVLRLIACMALNTKGPSCAIILPQPELVAYFASFLALISDTKRNFEERRDAFAHSGLQLGQNVQILPSGEVYQYGGVKKYSCGARFTLKLMGANSNNGTISLPLTDILRLQPTNRVRPYGKGKTPDKEMALSDLDKVLEIESYGNPSVFKNKVILHSTKQSLDSFLTHWDIHSPVRNAALKDLTDMPWGTINSSGELLTSDKYQAYGEPLIALSNRFSPIDAYCSEESEKTKTVISFNRKSVLRESYDVGSIVEKQKLLLITDHLDEKECEELHQQGIEIWKLNKNEIFIEGDTPETKEDIDAISPIRKLFTAANMDKAIIPVKTAESKTFSKLCKNIARLRNEIDDIETRNNTVSSLQRVMWRTSELLSLPGQDYQDWLLKQIMEIEESLADHSAFIRKDLIDTARETSVLITNELLPDIDKNSDEKFRYIKKHLLDETEGQTLILARHAEALSAVRARLASLKDKAIFLTYNEIASFTPEKGSMFETAIITGWPGKHLFLELLQAGIAKNIQAVLYPHEERIMERFFQQRKRADNQLIPSAEKKEEISGLSASLFISQEEEETGPQNTESREKFFDEPQEDLSITDSEDIFNVSWSSKPLQTSVSPDENIRPVKAKYVALSNDMCMYLDEDHVVSVISPKNHEYKCKKVDDLISGDVLVFRGGGEKEILREVATALYGQSYDKLWEFASLWKDWLRSLGKNPSEIWQKLVCFGLNRHPVTISQWLNYDDRIGPQNLNDILVIAKATGDENHINKAAKVADAIKQIRGVHVEAGFKLTSIVMQSLAGTENNDSGPYSELARKFSDVKLYTVEDIDHEYQDVSPDLVNEPLSLWFFESKNLLDELLEGTSNG